MSALLQPAEPLDFSRSIDSSTLKGRTAIITGGASGIGLAIATAIAESGAIVTIADNNEETGTQAAQLLEARGHAVQFVKTDVTSWDDQVAVFEQAAKGSSSQTVDIVVTAAGITTTLSHLPHPSELEKPTKPPTATYDINLYGTYYSMYLALWYFCHSPPDPVKQILFIASMAAYANTGESLSLDYSGSKAAVRGMWAQLRRLSSNYGGARHNMLAPIYIDTPMLEPGQVKTMRAEGWKVGTAEDVVDGAMRCICDGEVNGRAIAIGGGVDNGGNPGSANFDIRDEVLEHLGGKTLLTEFLNGVFMTLPSPSQDVAHG